MKKKHVFLAAGLMLAPLARAATEFEDSIPVDLAEIFLSVGEEGGLYRDLPDDFALDEPPQGFEVLGSVDQQFSSAVYLSTGLEAEPAVEALVQTLVDAGWLRLSSPFEARGDQGFTFADARGVPYSVQLCHEEDGYLNVTTGGSGEPRILTLRQNARPLQSPGCREQLEMRQRSFVRRAGGELGEYMPRLELPREGNYYGRRPGPVGGISGGSDEVETRTDLVIDWEPARLYEHFAGQLAEQGWTQDGEWATGRVAGGSWIREADGAELLGLVSIVRESEGEGEEDEEDEYHLRFRLLQSN